jgi:hypothetical protein
MSGFTPNRSIRYPLLGETSVGDVAMETMVRDLDAAYTLTDTNRSNAVHKPRARVENTGTQSLAKNAQNQLTVNTVIYDNAAMGNLAGNGLLCKVAGYYFVRVSAGLSVGATYQFFQVGVSRNGNITSGNNDFAQHKTSGAFFTGTTRTSAWNTWQLAVNDTITGYVLWTGTPAGPGTINHATIEAWMISPL